MTVLKMASGLNRVYPATPRRVAEIRHAVMALARALGADEDVVARACLAVSEAAANVVLHAYRDRPDPGDIRVVAYRDGAFLEVVVTDSGMGMAPRPDSPGLGLGLGLMSHQSESCELRAVPGRGTTVVLRFALRSGARA